MITHHKSSNICLVTDGLIVHGCNAQGVMGSGLASQLRNKYPDIFFRYCEHINDLLDRYIEPLGTVNFVPVTRRLTVANAITQEFYGRAEQKYVSYTALTVCLQEIANRCGSSVRIHMPYLIGAGLGGGDKETILSIIETTLKDCDVHLHHWV